MDAMMLLTSSLICSYFYPFTVFKRTQFLNLPCYFQHQFSHFPSPFQHIYIRTHTYTLDYRHCYRVVHSLVSRHNRTPVLHLALCIMCASMLSVRQIGGAAYM